MYVCVCLKFTTLFSDDLLAFIRFHGCLLMTYKSYRKFMNLHVRFVLTFPLVSLPTLSLSLACHFPFIPSYSCCCCSSSTRFCRLPLLVLLLFQGRRVNRFSPRIYVYSFTVIAKYVVIFHSFKA